MNEQMNEPTQWNFSKWDYMSPTGCAWWPKILSQEWGTSASLSNGLCDAILYPHDPFSHKVQTLLCGLTNSVCLKSSEYIGYCIKSFSENKSTLYELFSQLTNIYK
jgi:hypothetical protein